MSRLYNSAEVLSEAAASKDGKTLEFKTEAEMERERAALYRVMRQEAKQLTKDFLNDPTVFPLTGWEDLTIMRTSDLTLWIGSRTYNTVGVVSITDGGKPNGA